MNRVDSDRPRTVTCTSPSGGLQFVFYLELHVTQNQGSFTATCLPVYGGYSSSTEGAISGNNVTGVLVSSNGTFTDRIEYSGVVTGDLMVLRPTRYTQDWNPGYSCTCTGQWRA